ncbi:MAG: zf-HC2 domain-containing protein [Proteobacteria bacterium]|nr:zf-HC2 domain-containing protein [Pseudomonadota bacterium]
MSEVQRGGLWCHEVLGLLDRYVDAELTPSELSAVTEHVGGCDVCASFGGAYARTVQALRGEDPAPLGDAGLQRLTRRLEQEAS